MRALISVSDKTGVVEFAKELATLGIKIISTGGTSQKLKDEGVDVIGISEVTDFPECLDGRVKTLHPAVHGGILAMRDNPDHMQQLEDLKIDTIDIVAINLYPFKETIMKPDVTLPDAIENIDIGGPTMLRSSAKNHRDVVVVCDPSDYEVVINELSKNGEVSYDTKYKLALKVFEHTAAYDALIASYLRSEKDYLLPDNVTFTYEKLQDLRYGENPHQKAAYYKEIKPWSGALVNAEQLHGKELSFNNINDTNGALETLREFKDPAVVAVKHANPCGVGEGETIYDAYMNAYNADPVSIFGGIIAANKEIDKQTAEEINKIFIEIVIAPSYTDEALEVLRSKENIRILKLPNMMGIVPADSIDIKKIDGGILIQDIDSKIFDERDLTVVTKKQPTDQEMKDMIFGMKVVKHVKSNAIVLAKDGKTCGIGPGQTNRVGALEIAVRTGEAIIADASNNGESEVGSAKLLNGAVLASDAFFPFDDCVTLAGEAGITAIIQPGGSVRDEDSIKKADELGIAMVFTGMRHFKH